MFLVATAPRRFGKTFVVEQLAALARWNKDDARAFAGYAVRGTRGVWIPFRVRATTHVRFESFSSCLLLPHWQVLQPGSPFKPTTGQFHVIQLDFSYLAFKESDTSGDRISVDVARKSMIDMLVDSAKEQHSIDISDAGVDIGRAVELWEARLNARAERPIVLLVDEYDYLVAHTLDDPAMAELMAKDVLAPFFGATKLLAKAFHKVFVTGVSKFGVSSVFSRANHYLMLLEVNPDFCSLYGFTEAELRATYVYI